MKNSALTTTKTRFVSFTSKDIEASGRLKEALHNLLQRSKTEEGLIWYDVFQSRADATELYVLEIWPDDYTLEQHLARPHLREFAKICKTLLKAPLHAMAVTTPLPVNTYPFFAYGAGLN